VREREREREREVEGETERMKENPASTYLYIKEVALPRKYVKAHL
jgi:hypothetical protein